MTASSVGAEAKSTTGHHFGVWTLVALVVGNAIGAGIYTTSGYALADLGGREWVLLAWVVAGLIALMGALSYGMLAQGLTESGGEYLYLSRSIHPLAGFIAGWISLLAGFPGAVAFAATAFESYLISAFEFTDLVPDAIAVSVVIFAGIIHFVKIRTGAKTHEWLTLVMLVVLTVIIVGCAYVFSTGYASRVEIHSAAPFSWLAFSSSLVWISLSYSGFNAAAYVAGEVRDPKTSVVRGMVIGTLLTMLFCVSVNAIILYSAPISALQGQANVAAIAANALAGTWGQRAMEFIIAISLLTSITAMLLAGPRVYAKMAEDGALPRLFKNKQGQPPRAAIILQIGTALLLVLVADLQDLLSYLGLTLSLCLALAVSSLFFRHARFNEVPTSKWYPIAPVLFITATTIFAILMAISEPIKAFAVLPTVVIGALAYWISKNIETGDPHRNA